jgi:nitrite reductase/ring-hydroxylating ferredoxin subunit/DMSO/TMAO reductase YedYZ heme-binding membrane subunit
MSVRYQAVGWNRFKKSYDLTLAALLALFLLAFIGITLLLRPEVTVETLLIRGTSLAAFSLLHVILCIGPLTRLHRRFLPLLFNRRHLGVVMFLLATTHAAAAIIQFHAFSRINPFISLFTAYSEDYTSFLSRPADLANFPFEPMGALALGILFLMAATSHDFYLKNLGASLWKSLHLLVLPAYVLIVGHVGWGFLQSERSPGYLVMLGAGMAAVLGLHVAAALKERRAEKAGNLDRKEAYRRACRIHEIAEETGKVVVIAGERIALYRSAGRIFAVSNVCRHQGGPLGEGKILDGCITCPWHGWQYRAADGMSPPPFQEKVETYRVRTDGEFVSIDPEACAPGTAQEGAPAGATGAAPDSEEFFVGYLPQIPAGIRAFLRRCAISLAACGLGGALALATLQHRLGGGDFEFGTRKDYSGILSESPIPLLTPSDASTAAAPQASPLLLVGEGKAGLPDWSKGHEGERVRFRGTLIHRDSSAMVEMNDPESFRVVSPEREEESPPRQVGRYEMSGELVDPKCWLGVMRPSTGKVHRACAIRCLSGGIPPGLAVRDRDGKERLVLLAGVEGRRLEFDPRWAGLRVRATGLLEERGALPILRTDRLELSEEDR